MAADKPEPPLPERAPPWWAAPWVRRLAAIGVGIAAAVACPRISSPGASGICFEVGRAISALPIFEEPPPRCTGAPCTSFAGPGYTQAESDGGICSCPGRGP